MGAPGAGKTFYINANKFGDEYIASTEPLRKQQITERANYILWVRKRALLSLENNRSVIVDAVNVNAVDREYWLNAAKATGARTHLVVINTSLAKCLNSQLTRIYAVPNMVIRKYYTKFTYALTQISNEPWDIITFFER